MPETQDVGELEIAQDLEFQRRSWVVQRVGWGIMALATLAALLGLFGRGPLSRTTAGKESEPLSVEYNRFGRFQSPTTLRVHLTPDAGHKSLVRVWLDRNYLENVQLQQVTPEPERVEVGSERLIYVFQLSELNQSTAVTFYLQMEQIGFLPGQVGLVEGQTLNFNQFIYP